MKPTTTETSRVAEASDIQRKLGHGGNMRDAGLGADQWPRLPWSEWCRVPLACPGATQPSSARPPRAARSCSPASTSPRFDGSTGPVPQLR